MPGPCRRLVGPALAGSARPARRWAELQEDVRQIDRELRRLVAGLGEDVRLLDQTVRPVEDDVRRIRMLPFEEACAGLDRMVRDLSRAAGKEMRLEIAGGRIEIDRSILDGIKDPLIHLVRNAADHGIETPGGRRGAGKAPFGRIAVAAALHGNAIQVTVEDDGGGLDRAAIRREAARRGMAGADDETLLRGDLPARFLDQRRRDGSFPAAASDSTWCNRGSRRCAAA